MGHMKTARLRTASVDGAWVVILAGTFHLRHTFPLPGASRENGANGAIRARCSPIGWSAGALPSCTLGKGAGIPILWADGCDPRAFSPGA